MADFGIDVEGLQGALKALDTMDLRADDQTPIWQAVGPFLHAAALKRFQLGSQPTSWPRLKHPHPGPMLVKSGKMRDRIREKARKNGIVQRSSMKYSWVQQHGSDKSLGGYLKASVARAMVARGAKVRLGRKKSRDRVWVKGHGWAYVSRRGVKGRGKKKRVRREQAGRGGIDARRFLFIEEVELDRVVQLLTDYMVEAFGEDAVHGTP